VKGPPSGGHGARDFRSYLQRRGPAAADEREKVANVGKYFGKQPRYSEQEAQAQAQQAIDAAVAKGRPPASDFNAVAGRMGDLPPRPPVDLIPPPPPRRADPGALAGRSVRSCGPSRRLSRRSRSRRRRRRRRPGLEGGRPRRRPIPSPCPELPGCGGRLRRPRRRRARGLRRSPRSPRERRRSRPRPRRQPSGRPGLRRRQGRRRRPRSGRLGRPPRPRRRRQPSARRPRSAPASSCPRWPASPVPLPSQRWREGDRGPHRRR
jgi:hypothetical protein